jgi:Methyltransferase domain
VRHSMQTIIPTGGIEAEILVRVTGCCCHGVEEVFGERTARHDVRRYRRRGPSKPTRLLLDALEREGIAGATVLDIGGGVGAIQHELLAAGARHAAGVEASAAYLRVAAEEAVRRGNADRIAQRHGDFVALADEIEPADVVTLDRVICCYPDMESLVGRSADRARRLYGLVYPRDTWWVAVAIRVTNLGMRMTRRAFRAHMHRTSAVDAVAREHGLAPKLTRHAGPVWQVAVYECGTTSASSVLVNA